MSTCLYPYMVSLGMPEGITSEQQAEWLTGQFRDLAAQRYRLQATAESFECKVVGWKGVANDITVVSIRVKDSDIRNGRVPDMGTCRLARVLPDGEPEIPLNTAG